MNYLNRIIPIISIFGLIVLLATPLTAEAFSYWDVSGTLGLGQADLEESVVKIVQWILGLLGLVGVIMILYGGFIWLTSAGNEEKIAKAKKILSAAIIGLIVVILSWAIIRYSITVLGNVTGIEMTS